MKPNETHNTECIFKEVTNEKIILTFILDEDNFINNYFYLVNNIFPI